MLDNAKNNDTCVKELAKLYPGVDEKRSRLRCAGHIINLVVKAILFGKGVTALEKELCGASEDETFAIWTRIGPIGKIHNLSVYINRTDQRREEFFGLQKELSEQANIPGENEERAEADKVFFYKLLQDGGVHWNSAYYMIRRGM